MAKIFGDENLADLRIIEFHGVFSYLQNFKNGLSWVRMAAEIVDLNAINFNSITLNLEKLTVKNQSSSTSKTHKVHYIF
jgi:hypothetical protein